jgi:ubiquinone/menaquinone biosynthesis C-methylase UbiE
MDEYRQSNRSMWDELTEINARSKFYDLDGFKAGRIVLNPLELEELGPYVAGKRLLHLQCHFGMDTLSWARMGAEVTGVDFSPHAIELATAIATELNIPARFLCTDIYELPKLLDETFDIVFTSYGVLTWLSDLNGWAKLVARYLKPGGIFYIAEFHPFAMMLDDESDTPRLRYDYFDKDMLVFPNTTGSYADRSVNVRTEFSYEWQHTLGEIISALCAAGLRIDFLHEHESMVFQMASYMVESSPGVYRLPPGHPRMPLEYSLMAHKV